MFVFDDSAFIIGIESGAGPEGFNGVAKWGPVDH